MGIDDWSGALDERLRRQLEFLIEIDRLKTVLRGTRLADGSRRENTAEHSWHLALFAMVLAEHADDAVDTRRVVSMLLIHDIVEIDAGDTPVFGGTPAADQADREQRAADRLFGLLPHDQADEFRRLWDEFEAAESVDARFAKALDRLQPSLLNHEVGGGTWTDYDVDEATERATTGRVAGASPALGQALDAVITDAVATGMLRPDS